MRPAGVSSQVVPPTGRRRRVTGVQIRLEGSDPVSVEAAADELKARFGPASASPTGAAGRGAA